MEAMGRGSICMRMALKTRWAALGEQTRCYSLASSEQEPPVTPVAFEHHTDYDSIGPAKFRELAFIPEKPLLMKAGPMFLQSAVAMPAIRKWFDFKPYHGTAVQQNQERKAQNSGKFMSPYLRSFASTTILPFELAYPQSYRLHGEAIHKFIEHLRQEGCPDLLTDGLPSNPYHKSFAKLATPFGLANFLESQLPPSSELLNKGQNRGRPENHPMQKILHFTAPLALLDAAVKYNLERPSPGMRKLYVAQAPLNDLPKQLQDDLTVPNIVKVAGKGDIYNSSIWLGLELTYTPLHRDPNPNLFVQLCGNKVVRLLPPASGDQVFRQVQLRLGNSLHVNSRLRGPEMMDGPERDLMHDAVWHRSSFRDNQTPQGTVQVDQDELPKSKMQEAKLQPGDALFIPKGWWHSVKSEYDSGRLNASVNWWFR